MLHNSHITPSICRLLNHLGHMAPSRWGWGSVTGGTSWRSALVLLLFLSDGFMEYFHISIHSAVCRVTFCLCGEHFTVHTTSKVLERPAENMKTDSSHSGVQEHNTEYFYTSSTAPTVLVAIKVSRSRLFKDSVTGVSLCDLPV